MAFQKHIKTYWAVALLLLPIVRWGYAQPTEINPEFRTGTVIFADGQKHKLNFSFNINQSILQVRYGNQLKAYGANQVKSFWYYDEKIGQERDYATYNFALYSDLPSPTFFEVQLQGQPLSLLSREYVVIENVPQFDAFTNRTVYVTQQRLKVELFFKDPNDNITKFFGNRKHLQVIMSDEKNKIRDFVRDNNFNLQNKNHVMQITAYYNRLKQNKK